MPRSKKAPRSSTPTQDRPMQVGLQRIPVPAGEVPSRQAVSRQTVPKVPSRHAVPSTHALDNRMKSSSHKMLMLPVPCINPVYLPCQVLPDGKVSLGPCHIDAAQFHIPLNSLPAGAFIGFGTFILNEFVQVFGTILHDGSVFVSKTVIGKTTPCSVSYHNDASLDTEPSVESYEPLTIPLPEDLELNFADTVQSCD